MFTAKMTEKTGKSRLCAAYLNEMSLTSAFSQMADMGMTQANIQGGLMTLCLVREEAEEPPPEPGDDEAVEAPEELRRSHFLILFHSLGMETNNYRRSLKWWLEEGISAGHRNHFCVAVDSTRPPGRDHRLVLDLVARGLMIAGTTLNGDKNRYFHVTEAGIRLAREEFFRARAAAKA